MDSILPPGFSPETAGAKSGQKPGRRRMTVVAGTQSYDIMEFWGDGFSVARDGPEPDRGFVDVFDGARHILHCLAYKTGESDKASIYAFKIGQDAAMRQPQDYARAADAPIALIEKH
jgi:hypothetical protein